LNDLMPDKILAKEKVDHAVLYVQLRKKGVSITELVSAFKVLCPLDRFSQIEILDEAKAATILSLIKILAPSASRIEAAQHGDSHKKRVSGALVNLFFSGDPHPSAIINTAESMSGSGKPFAQSVLVIENLELFVRVDETLSFIDKHCGRAISRSDTDIIYGAGTGICNQLNADFLSQYQTIYCLLDIDPGGLAIYKGLQSIAGESSNVIFIMPTNLEDMLHASPRKLSEAERGKVAKTTGLTDGALEALKLIYKTHKTLEQELYLGIKD